MSTIDNETIFIIRVATIFDDHAFDLMCTILSGPLVPIDDGTIFKFMIIKFPRWLCFWSYLLQL